VGNSEKPDVVAGKLLEGRVAIIVDGTPFALVVPYLFVESLQSAEDYYARPFFATLLRLLRVIAFTLSILLPALYVAMASYHQELLPSALAITLARTREGTPFPAIFEALTMGVVFEILREAGVRLPRPVGQAITIVGALVIGQSAVQAGLIGSLMVIVVAFTGMATFAVPALVDVVVILRVVFTLLAGVLGFYGIVVGLMLVTAHAATLSSFGTPFLWPLAPFSASGLLDTFVRAPLWVMRRRPAGLHPAVGVRRGRRPRLPRRHRRAGRTGVRKT
jgi:spore germination protein KA